MLTWNNIEESNSPYNDPLLILKKSDGAVRLVLDARMVNKIIEPERDRPPKIEEIRTKFNDTKYNT